MNQPSLEKQVAALSLENQKLQAKLRALEQTDEALQAADDRIRLIHDAAPLAMILFNREWNVLEWNPAAEKIFGYTPNDIIGKSVLKIIPDDLLPGLELVMDQVEQEAGGKTNINENMTKSGRRIICAWRNECLKDKNGNLIGVVSFARDITEEETAKKSLLESEERLQLIYDTSNDGIWDWDIKANQVYWSKQMFALLGYEPDAFSVTYETVGSLWHPDDRAEYMKTVERHLATNESYVLENRMLHVDGTYRWFQAIGQALRDENGEPFRMIGVTTDITQRKQVEEQQKLWIEKLEEKNDELERFTYTVSHELKSPLVTINGFIWMLEKDIRNENESAVAEDCQEITTAVNKMRFLLEDLLELSRIGRVKHPHQLVDLDELVQSNLQLLQRQIAQSQVMVTLESELPKFQGDVIRWEQIVHNFIDNAVKYRATENPEIQIGIREEGNKKYLYVQDNGIGIDPKFHEKIFDLFQQLNPRAEGTGIGLALAHRIAQIQGSKLKVESEGLGKGSTFLISLPTIEN
ncbi:MAG: hypothetical protein COA78_08805 [Blastopirellula sp.]|nr:MAG: hypothetical protein COA78_08805 [Blastopirellula sp.]